MKIVPRIDRMVNKGKVKAIASVSLDGMFVVKNLKIMDGKKGLFVSMPQESYPGKDGQTKYSNTFFALTNSAKMQLQEVVLGAYQQALHPEQHNHPQSYGQGNYPQECQYQQEHYPQPEYRSQYPEPQYPEWVNECDAYPEMDMAQGY